MKKSIVILSFAVVVAAPAVTLAAPQSSFAATPKTPADCEKALLPGINPWFRGLTTVTNGKCEIVSPGGQLSGGKTLDLAGFIWRIALNIVDIGLAIVGYIAFIFILYGGFQFLTGGNNPSQIEKARKTILNAVVGLVISLGAVAIINLIFGIIGG
ncbi:MAG: hypothetical protein EOT05_01265 [Candidatus Microsaccharimonas sossegonensis]|uniref:TrbC/VIRB2 family protein n=1 Tax=Candidatus Microsaccharimonas sossegonensis TaxID=2506948 RepID=A0A4V1J7E2_9BACT|nr:MAG: hypothetical protein EOT05_01265 [Candidatus Microsaccharimonas sossegonensis]